MRRDDDPLDTGVAGPGSTPSLSTSTRSRTPNWSVSGELSRPWAPPVAEPGAGFCGQHGGVGGARVVRVCYILGPWLLTMGYAAGLLMLQAP